MEMNSKSRIKRDDAFENVDYFRENMEQHTEDNKEWKRKRDKKFENGFWIAIILQIRPFQTY